MKIAEVLHGPEEIGALADDIAAGDGARTQEAADALGRVDASVPFGARPTHPLGTRIDVEIACRRRAMARRVIGTCQAECHAAAAASQPTAHGD